MLGVIGYGLAIYVLQRLAWDRLWPRPRQTDIWSDAPNFWVAKCASFVVLGAVLFVLFMLFALVV